MGKNYNIHAMKVNAEWAKEVHDSIINDGEARFGWSYNNDLNNLEIKKRIESGQKITEEQKKCYFKWLINDIKVGDYLVYINVPTYGEVTITKVTKAYYWKTPSADDFNHCFGIDKNTVYEFNRNSSIVHPYLSARLKLQGKHWRIYGCDEHFNELLLQLQKGNTGEERTISHNIKKFNRDINGPLTKIADILYKTFPNKSLEELLQIVFKNIPNVISVDNIKGSADKGADLIIRYDKKLPFLSNSQETWYVQVKSYSNECYTTSALDGLKKAIEEYNDGNLTEAIIAITSSYIDDNVLKEIKEYNEDSNNKVHVTMLNGVNLVRFILKYIDLDD